jgi:hypothetical protein
MDTLLPLTGCGLMIISLGYVITFWFRTMSAFDKFVQYECENLPEQWERDGQPFGMFWKPKDKKVRAINRYFFSNPGIAQFRLLFKTPDWIKEHPEAADHLKQIRRYTLFWNIGVIVWFAVVFPAIIFVFTPR